MSKAEPMTSRQHRRFAHKLTRHLARVNEQRQAAEAAAASETCPGGC